MAGGKKCGIVGLPNVGKSTLFNFVMKEEIAEVANYPFCTIEPNIRKRHVKDKRLEKIAEKKKSEKIIYADLEIYDIAGLVKGASEGEGLGNKFLGNILEVDLIIHVVRLFKGSEEMQLDTIDPILDFQIIETELFLWDMKRVEDMIQKHKKNPDELKTLNDTLKYLQEEKYPPKSSIPLITSKPIILLGNGNDPVLVERMQEFCKKRGLQFFYFDFHEKDENNLDALILQAYKTLNLLSFFTCGPKEARAWTVKKGTNYKEAGGEIHSDIKNGFICAHVVNWEFFEEKPTIMKKALDVVEDGDVILFKHH
jgi:small GTP-binding protein